ncbi:uncharacterized protein troap isoform X1 [Clarias gariepinus]|uniref:uncharacterized protein troap isoform X1 n=1 Tax=Clarias gariepinus TaxID=13013 RepID=UPI00234C34A8|nr:uncharacterized protein troap isoform X1 [Clarias gariepinus]XP_053337850.1 uncharacterized protein troap isoform X1 [Clarias gariepinus]
MASSASALRPINTSQKDRVGILKRQDLNKVPENSRVKLFTAQSSERGAENKDPNESAKPAKGVNKQTAVSRLPVLAKSLQTAVTDFPSNPANKRWEERPLLGKAQKKKTCTKPVPFNFSQPRTRNQKRTEACSEPETKPGNLTTHLNQHTLVKPVSVFQHRTQTGAARQNTGSNKVSLSTEILRATTLELNNPEKGNDLALAIQKDLSTKLGNITLVQTELGTAGGFSSKAEDCFPSGKGFIQTPLSADCKTGGSEQDDNAVASSRTPPVSTCPAGQGSSVFLPQRVSVKKKKGYWGAEATSENSMPFSPDPSALRSILLNEGIKVGGTPKLSTCPSGRATSICSAKRVPIKKPQTHTAASGGEPTGDAVTFSPEGVKQPMTPRACPSGATTSVCSAQRVPFKKNQTNAAASDGETAGGAVTFSPDPSALHRIQLNDGLKQTMTPRACPSGRATSIFSAQRVPVKKAPSEASTAAGTVSFSPDPSALRSILDNEGITAGSMLRVSVCPSGRATSICTAQRVPVKRTRAEETAHTAASVIQTPIRKWTPQRVPVSQSQSVKRLNPAQKTPCISSGFGETQAPSIIPSSQQQEDVVQRLFQEEPEHVGSEQMKDAGGEVTQGHLLEHHQGAEQNLKCKGGADVETHSCVSLSEKEKIPAVPPFIQAPHRQSVIVFSSGQKLLAQNRAQTASQHAAQPQPCPNQTSRSHSELDSQTERPVTPGKLCKTKASSLNLAMCALKRRLPTLEELFLDEECAMYTSRQQSWPTQPRCYNPVASTLVLQDSTCFVPIMVTLQSLSPIP